MSADARRAGPVPWPAAGHSPPAGPRPSPASDLTHRLALLRSPSWWPRFTAMLRSGPGKLHIARPFSPTDRPTGPCRELSLREQSSQPAHHFPSSLSAGSRPEFRPRAPGRLLSNPARRRALLVPRRPRPRTSSSSSASARVAGCAAVPDAGVKVLDGAGPEPPRLPIRSTGSAVASSTILPCCARWQLCAELVIFDPDPHAGSGARESAPRHDASRSSRRTMLSSTSSRSTRPVATASWQVELCACAMRCPGWSKEHDDVGRGLNSFPGGNAGHRRGVRGPGETISRINRRRRASGSNLLEKASR